MTAADWSADPRAARWLSHVRHQVLPKLQDSVVSMVIAPSGEPDLKLAVEVGLSILLDKPLIVVCQPGQVPPPGLARVAHHCVEADVTAPGGGDALLAALRRYGAAE